jgi:hypothetical protein
LNRRLWHAQNSPVNHQFLRPAIFSENAQFPGETVDQGQKRIELIANKVLPRLR